MAMRLQELHPAAVHLPIALVPLSLVADALGRATGNRGLMEVGRRTMPLAAASAAVAGVLGLVAQEAVKTDETTDAMLTTHRNLNLVLVALTAAMARQRLRRLRPGRGYLALGAAGMAAMTYSAYLGGRMVYEYGVGVKAADGLLDEMAPEITPATAGAAAALAAEHLRKGVRHTGEYLARGEIAPLVTGSGEQPVQPA